MKAGSGPHFEQSYNAQAAVEVDSRLIVGERVSQACNDKQELAPTVAAVAAPVESVADVLADSGFYSEAAVRAVEQTPTGQPTGTTVYAALEKKEHHRTVSDLEKKEEPAAPAAGSRVERGDEAPAENEGWQSQVQIAAADGGTGLWHHQERDGIPAISAARTGKGRAGMAVGLRRLQPQTVTHLASGSETGPLQLKNPREKSRAEHKFNRTFD